VADVEEKDPDDTLDQTLPNNPDQSEETESEYDPYAYTAPKLSDLTIFQEWRDSAPRDRFTEEFSLARYPDQDMYGSGSLALPEWYPKSYASYANNFDLNSMFTRGRLQETIFPNVNEEERLAALMRELGLVDSGLEEAGYPDPILGLAQAYGVEAVGVPIVGVSPFLESNTTTDKFWNPQTASFVDNPNYNPDAVFNSTYEIMVNDKSFLRDLSKLNVLSGESIAEQDWFDEGKRNTLEKFFADQKHPSLNGTETYLEDKSAIGKSLTYARFKEALARGVDPDIVFAELEKIADKPQGAFERPNDESFWPDGPPALGVENAMTEHFANTRDAFYEELNDLRQNDGAAFVETYAYLPVQDKLRYLNSLYDSKEISKDEYEGLFVQEVNALYNPEFTPNNFKFVEVEGKTYLDVSGNVETKEYHLYEPEFYALENEDDYNFFNTIGGQRGSATKDFDSSVWDFFDPIVSVVSIFAPVVGAIYTGVKALSGEGLNTSDWLRALPGISQGLEAAGVQTSTTLGQLIPDVLEVLPPDVAEALGSITVGLPSGPTGDVASQVGAVLTQEGAVSPDMGQIITIGGKLLEVSEQRRGPDSNNNGVPDVEEAVIDGCFGYMRDAGVPIPEGAFQVNEDGKFINRNGEPVGFSDVFDDMLNLFREEKPIEFSEAIINTPEEFAPTIGDTVGAAVYNVAKFLVDDAQKEKVFGGEDSAGEQAVATILGAAGETLNAANGLISYLTSEVAQDNTKVAKLARNLLALGDSTNTKVLKESVSVLEELEREYVDVEFTANPLGNTMLNGMNFMYEAIKKAPLAVTAELAKELVQEVVPLVIGGGVGLAVKGLLKAGQYAAAANKLATAAGVGAGAITDIVEGAGGSANEAYNTYLNTQVNVARVNITGTGDTKGSVGFEALKRKLSEDVINGRITEEQFGQELRAYVDVEIEKLMPGFRENAAAGAEEAFYVGGGLAFVSLFTGGLAADKKVMRDLLGDDVSDVFKEIGEKILDEAKEVGGATAKEMVSGYAEEYITQAHIASENMQFDPSITPTDVMREAAFAGALGAVLEGGTGAGSMGIGKLTANAFEHYNPEIAEVLQTGPEGEPLYTQEEVDQVLNTVIGSAYEDLEDGSAIENNVKTILLDTVYDEAYTTPDEAGRIFAEENYIPTEQELQEFVGDKFGNSTIGQGIYEYVDPRQLTEEELDLIIGDIGVTLTAEQRAELIRQYTEPLDNQTRVQNFIDSLDKDEDLSPPPPTTYTAGELVGPDEQGRYRIAGEDGETLSEEFYDKDGNPYVAPDDTGKNIYDYTLMETILPEGSLIKLENGDLVPADDPRFEGKYTDSNGNQNVDSIDIREGRARFNDDGVLEFVDSDGNYSSDDTGGKDDKDDKDDPLPTTTTPTPATTSIPQFSKEKDYLEGDVVTDVNGVLYRADRPVNKDTAGLGNDYYWQRIVTIDYDPNLEYRQGDIVNQNGVYYRAKSEIIANSAGLGNTEYWAPVPISGNARNFTNLDRDTGADPAPDTGAQPPPTTDTGLTPEQINQIVQGVLDGLPSDITGDVKDAVKAVLGNLDPSTLSTLTEAQVRSIVDGAVKQITGDISGVAKDVSGLATDVSDVQDTVDNIEDALTKGLQEGKQRDEALNGAIDQVAKDLGLTRTQLLEAIGETEQTLLSRLGEVESAVSSEIDAIADLLGKPAQEVTQADIDTIEAIIAQEEVATQQLLQYDVNQDGVIDINDQTLLEQALAGQDVSLQGQFAPTGLFAEQAQTQQDIETAQELATEQAIQTQQQIQSSADELRKRRNVSDLTQQILQSEDLFGRQATISPQDVARINYLYDIGGDSIFATPQQEALFTSPYAKGGLLNRNRDLLRMLGED
jgi:hypothetical protein